MNIAALLLLATAPATAAPPPPAPPGNVRQITLSTPGRAIAEKHFAEPTPEILAVAKQAQDVKRQIAALIGQPMIDIAKLQTLVRQDEKLQADLRRLSNDRMIGLLKALPEADRGAFLRGVTASAPPAPPPAPKP